MHGKPRAVVTAAREAVVAVTKHKLLQLNTGICLLLAFFAVGVRANVLPDERIDLLYHSYEGGGTQIDGPAILVRKNIGTSISVSGQYYIDSVSGASIDVQAQGGSDVDAVSGATPYSEERKQYDLGMEYLHNRTTLNLGYSTSNENDYNATTYTFGISQTFFGDLTTVNLGVSLGQDVVGKNTDPSLALDKEGRKYRLGITQILTKNLIANLNFETVADRCIDVEVDESCLNNPYRFVRFVDPSQERGYGEQPEFYPHTHNSDAIGIRAIYYLPYRATMRADYRTFSDSWGIEASNYEIRYTHPYTEQWVFEVKYRAYEQTGADFYSDLFPFRDAQNFMARDKELSPLTTTTLGLGTTYQLPAGAIPWFDKSTVNLYWDRIQIDYKDFRNVLAEESVGAGQEPLYSLDADVIRFYMSFWF